MASADSSRKPILGRPGKITLTTNGCSVVPQPRDPYARSLRSIPTLDPYARSLRSIRTLDPYARSLRSIPTLDHHAAPDRGGVTDCPVRARPLSGTGGRRCSFGRYGLRCSSFPSSGDGDVADPECDQPSEHEADRARPDAETATVRAHSDPVGERRPQRSGHDVGET